MQVREGGCLCGRVRYRMSGKPAFVTACHCRFCQKRTGAAFGMAAYVPKAQVEFLSGAMKPYEYKSDETGRWLRMEHCENCGTTVTWTLEVFPELRALAAGTFDDPKWLKPERHVWTRSGHEWMRFPEGVQVFEKGRPVS